MRARFNGAAVTLSGLIGGAVGLGVAFFLRALIRNTPAVVRTSTYYWWFVLLGGVGALWGVATQSMKQLERSQGYEHDTFMTHRYRSRLGSGGKPSAQVEPESDPDPTRPGPGS
ncbi:hypothetical protein EVJ50_12750 [Synechococcus sp. RSCCF101]|uniref:hypothetical protein n=1 Tax=Synechococcus sp. RSCCF101 TaxID=2511069 RepID=UPI0012481ADB|nr:hypothetical protein [Synechococcus sp. RSCCF101]QEY32966.1 hypothetical protein EVJ50_12750 [Synechococcus sp. RSCCF101]